MQFLIGLLVGGALGCLATALCVSNPDPEDADDLWDAMEELDEDEPEDWEAADDE